ncbi:hypothetical protein BV20DRAFT_949893 [Pilatotrama ljubarskyi]|nr:hypothetical protein BV20DRAFT_949893 [Pilatotrama ljubarskyi]
MLPPPPPWLADTSRERGPEVSPCSAHFVDGGRALVVCYTGAQKCWDISTWAIEWHICPETRIARSAISPDQKSLVLCNLHDGFDRYRLDRRRKVQTYAVTQGENVALPVVFIHGGEALIFGSGCGTVAIVDKDDGSLLQELRHTGPYDEFD